MDTTSYFNAEQTRDELVKWIRKWFDVNGKTSKAVIGISGGKDSTIVAALCVRALGRDRVYGVMMPNGEQKDIDDSIRVCESLGIDNCTINILDSYDGIINQMIESAKLVPSEQTYINLAPRLRMSALYAVSQSIGGRVVNTSNLSEFSVGYFTRWADECGDLKPLVNLTKTEVVEIGKTLTEIPLSLIIKTPSDGLSGQSDEDKLGFKYDNLDSHLRGLPVFNTDELVRITDKIEGCKFKRKPPNAFSPQFK